MASMIKIFYWEDNKVYQAMKFRQTYTLYNPENPNYHQFIRTYKENEIMEEYHNGRVIKA